MKIPKLFLFLFLLCLISCNIFAMETLLKAHPFLNPKDSEKIIEGGSFFPENCPTLDFVVIAEKSNQSEIIREHYLINNIPYKNFVYSKNTIIPHNAKDRSEAIQELILENYQQSEKLIQEQEKNAKLTIELTNFKNSYLNSLIWAGAIMIGSLIIGGSIIYCNQPSLQPGN